MSAITWQMYVVDIVDTCKQGAGPGGVTAFIYLFTLIILFLSSPGQNCLLRIWCNGGIGSRE